MDNLDKIVDYLKQYGDYFVGGLPWIAMYVSKGNLKYETLFSEVFLSYKHNATKELSSLSIVSIHPSPLGYRLNSSIYSAGKNEVFAQLRMIQQYSLRVLKTKTIIHLVVVQCLEKIDMLSFEKELTSQTGEKLSARADDPIDGVIISRPIDK